MPRKRKRARDTRDKGEAEAARKPPPRVGTELGAVLKQAGLTRVVTTSSPARTAGPGVRSGVSEGARPPTTLAPPGPERASLVPPPPPKNALARTLSAAELRLLNDAYQGARPLSVKSERLRNAADVAPRVNPRTLENAQDRSEELAARKRLAELVSGGVRFKVQKDDDYVEGLRADTSPKLLARLQGSSFTPEATLDLHGLRASQVGSAVERFLRAHQRRGARHVLLIAGKGLHSEDGISVLGPAVVEALSHGLAAPWVRAFSTAHSVHGGSGAIAVLLRD